MLCLLGNDSWHFATDGDGLEHSIAGAAGMLDSAAEGTSEVFFEIWSCRAPSLPDDCPLTRALSSSSFLLRCSRPCGVGEGPGASPSTASGIVAVGFALKESRLEELE